MEIVDDSFGRYSTPDRSKTTVRTAFYMAENVMVKHLFLK